MKVVIIRRNALILIGMTVASGLQAARALTRPIPSASLPQRATIEPQATDQIPYRLEDDFSDKHPAAACSTALFSF